MTKPLVIYHDNCADGFGAAFAAWTKLGDDAEYLPMQHGKTPLHVVPTCYDREVYILDFSFPKETMAAIFQEAKRVVWLDHHKTAFEMWCDDGENQFYQSFGGAKDHYIVLDNNKSGALLAWEFFHPDTEVPMFVRHIDDYDRWQFKNDRTKAFNKALWSYAPWSFSQWADWFYDCEMKFDHLYWTDDFYTGGEAILRAHQQNVMSVVKSARKCELPLINKSVFAGQPRERFIGLVVNCPSHLSSDVGHELANRSGTFGLCWSLDAENIVRCSLRSNGDYDVSDIAKAFAGGGHRNAAGFSTDINTLMGWLK